MRVYNNEQIIEFDGRLLAERDTEERDSLRWTVVQVYRTRAGNYVVHKVGRSVVYHVPGAKCGGQAVTRDVAALSTEEYELGAPCPRCTPPDLEDLQDGSVAYERDRHSAHVAETAEGCVAACGSLDGNGVRFISRVARSALEHAAREDAALRDAVFGVVSVA